MPFELAATKQPVAIPKITISLDETPGTEAGTIRQSVCYELTILYDDNSEMRRYGDLVPHLTQQQITDLQTFMADLRTLAETEILP